MRDEALSGPIGQLEASALVGPRHSVVGPDDGGGTSILYLDDGGDLVELRLDAPPEEPDAWVCSCGSTHIKRESGVYHLVHTVAKHI